MNLPAHIIMCSPPAMNLPAHDTTNISWSKSHITTSRRKLRKAHCNIRGTYSSWSYGFQCFHEPTRSWSNSMDLLARSSTLRTYPLVFQHAWTPTMNLPAHSSLKCEHGTYEPPRSYPHTRVQQIRTSPPASIMHFQPSLRTYPLVTSPIYPWPNPHKEPCKTHNKANYHSTIAWCSPYAVRRSYNSDCLTVLIHRQAPHGLESPY